MRTRLAGFERAITELAFWLERLAARAFAAEAFLAAGFLAFGIGLFAVFRDAQLLSCAPNGFQMRQHIFRHAFRQIQNGVVKNFDTADMFASRPASLAMRQRYYPASRRGRDRLHCGRFPCRHRHRGRRVLSSAWHDDLLRSTAFAARDVFFTRQIVLRAKDDCLVDTSGSVRVLFSITAVLYRVHFCNAAAISIAGIFFRVRNLPPPMEQAQPPAAIVAAMVLELGNANRGDVFSVGNSSV